MRSARLRLRLALRRLRLRLALHRLRLRLAPRRLRLRLAPRLPRSPLARSPLARAASVRAPSVRARAVRGSYALVGETRAQVVERARLLALVDRPAILVPHLEVVHHPDDHHVLRKAAALAIVLQHLDAPVRIEHHVESRREVHVLEAAAIGIHLRELRDALLEVAPLVFRVHVERGAVGRHHEPVTAGLAQHLAKLRRDAEPPLRVDRVPEVSPKHFPPSGAPSGPWTSSE